MRRQGRARQSPSKYIHIYIYRERERNPFKSIHNLNQRKSNSITDEVPPRISVVDLATAITGKDANHAAQDVAYVKERHPEVTTNCPNFRFRGRGQKSTPVTGPGLCCFIICLFSVFVVVFPGEGFGLGFSLSGRARGPTPQGCSRGVGGIRHPPKPPQIAPRRPQDALQDTPRCSECDS